MILLLVAFLLDSILSNYFPYSISSLTWFQPCFFVVFLVFLYFKVKRKDIYLKKGIFYIILGSLIFGNSVFLRLISFVFIFLFLAFITKKYHSNIKIFLISLISSLFIHFYTTYLISLVFRKITFSFIDLLWLFIHYILFNIISGICFYYFFGIKKLKN